MARPGKFEASGDIGERLHELSMDGVDEELGDVGDFGWYGLLLDVEGVPDVRHAIVTEDNDGFFDYESFDTKADALKEWKRIEKEYEEFFEEEAE